LNRAPLSLKGGAHVRQAVLAHLTDIIPENYTGKNVKTNNIVKKGHTKLVNTKK
jgi:hypothetical protein